MPKVTVSGRVIQFPDNMSQSDIQTAIERDILPGLMAQSKPAAPPDPAQGIGAFQSAIIGAGRTGDKVISGVRQLYNQAIGDNKTLNALAEREKSNDAAYSKLQEKHPFATSLGEALPYVAVPASMGILPTAALVGGAEALQYGTPQQRIQKGAVGAVTTGAAGLVGRGVNKLLSPVSDDLLTVTQKEALQAADRVGYKPRLSEVTGSPYASALEDFAARTPGGSGVMKSFDMANKRAMNSAAASAIGESANELSSKVFSDAASRIGKAFEDIKTLPGRPIQINQSVSGVADDILRSQSKMLPGQQDSQLIKLAQQAKALANNAGRIDGETYQLTRSGLSEAAFDASGTNKKLYGQLLSALDDSAEQSLKRAGMGDLADAVRAARPQYASLKTLEKGATVNAGSVSPSRVASTLRTNNPGAFREGRMSGNPLYDLAMIGENMPALKAGSPTYERGVTSNLLETVLKAPFAYGAAKLTTSPFVTAYPRYIGSTPIAQVTGQLAEPASRALSATLFNRLLPLTGPVMAENY